ncbi:hypothetical protein [Solidesulfovibrio sp.]
MNITPSRTGRPLPAAGAMTFAGAALIVLLGRELLPGTAGGHISWLFFATTCVVTALAVGWRMVPALAAKRDPAGLLAPCLGLLAVCLPTGLLLSRLGRSLPDTVGQGFFQAGMAVGIAASMLPLGLVLGAGLGLATRAARRTDPPQTARLPLFIAGGAILGALFVILVAVPKLSPLNACLDMGIGCVAIGILSAAAAPQDNRNLETWLSLLAVVFVLLLPLSGLLDDKTSAWCIPPAVSQPE